MSSHAEFLRAEGGDDTLVKDLKKDPTQIDTSAQDRAMIDFALKLTSTPSAMTPDDHTELKRHGFTDEQIVDIVLITCAFNFMDRLADGLGVELDPEMQKLIDRNANKG